MPTEQAPAGGLRGGPYVYELARKTRREELLRERIEVEGAAVRLMKSALRMGGVYGGIVAALQIALETVADLVELDRRIGAYTLPVELPYEAAVGQALELARDGGWSADPGTSTTAARWVPNRPAAVTP
ncbi:hypothetical protein [Jiangella sp. DSM 45060]|uniref:hypothetical protein n=1 Tax=Jiangella sp. DSM 45060 TaxID=1798224 RepID=UPI00087D9A14|nr:hypothetical protein [Jiangella sp. DSM 45060]SDT69587.1 hypothetical protein SAMN04515669_6043 [Jiangella sp. DSM 45060]